MNIAVGYHSYIIKEPGEEEYHSYCSEKGKVSSVESNLNHVESQSTSQIKFNGQ